MALSENAVLAKVRAMHGRMLSPAQYDELLRKQNVQELSAYLREKTVYREVLEGIQDSTIHRGQLENLLEKEAFRQYARLIHYAPMDTGLYQLTVRHLEVELILGSLRGIISGHGARELLSDLPTFLQPYIQFQLLDLAKAESVDQLITALQKTPYGQILSKAQEHLPTLPDGRIRYTRLELALRSAYFRKALELADQKLRGTGRKQARELIGLRAELLNLQTLWRLKLFPEIPAEIQKRLLLPFSCRLSRQQLERLIQAKDREAFCRALEKTSYGRAFSEDAEGSIESMGERLRYRLCQRMIRFSTEPQVVYLAFMMLQRMETEDVVRVIEGVRYRMPAERIQRLLHTVNS